MTIYALLEGIKARLEKYLQYSKSKKEISSFILETIPDDLKINIVVMRAAPVVSIKININIKV
jgi:hypothetical protein